MKIIVEPGLALNYLTPDSDITAGHLATTANIYVISLKTLTQQWPRIHDILKLGGLIIIEKTDESVVTQWHVATSLHYSSWIKSGQIRWITGVSVFIHNHMKRLTLVIWDQNMCLPSQLKIPSWQHGLR